MARVRFKYLRQSDIEQHLGSHYNAQQEKDYIEQWISKRLWAIEAKKNISLNADIKSRVRDYREALLISQFKKDLIMNKIVISENDVIDYYDKHNGEFKTDTDAAYIDVFIFGSQNDANAAVGALEHSENPPTPAQRKLVHKGECIDALDSKIFSKNAKNLVGPVAHRGEFYVISVIDRYSPNSLLRVEHVREDIIQRLQMAEYVNTLQLKEKELKERINVKIFKNTDN